MSNFLRTVKTCILPRFCCVVQSNTRNFSVGLCHRRNQLSTLTQLKSGRITIVAVSNKKYYHAGAEERSKKNKNSLYYLSAFTILVGGFTYASVLLYRIYCQTTGKGGQAVIDEAGEKVAGMTPIKNRIITVNFNADINSTMRWNFKPQQPFIKVSPGETALAFYTATNPTDKPITGVATYNILPFEAGKYFNKIQCFCFEEQQLNPKEEVDMPVFFYLDPEYVEDPRLEQVKEIILSYTFFEAKEGMQLPRPNFG